MENHEEQQKEEVNQDENGNQEQEIATKRDHQTKKPRIVNLLKQTKRLPSKFKDYNLDSKRK